MKPYLKTFLIFVAFGIILLGVFAVSPNKSFEELAPKYAAAPSVFMEVSGLKIHYRDQGQGYPIVLIHGTGASLHTWDAWTEELIKTQRVIRLDLPAYGLTGQDPHKRYSSKDYVNLLDTFLGQLGVKEFHLGGNSLGGLVSWLYASYHDQKVNKLLLLNPSGFQFDSTPMIIKLAKTPVVNYFLRYITPKSFIKKTLKEVYYDDDLITKATVDRYYDLTLFEGNRDAFIDRSFIEREDYTERLSLIQSPALVLWGENDEWIPVEDAEKFEAYLNQATVVIMPKTGHIPMEERPKESVAIALDFLSN
jgi:pimeloyl-ACP methyl ester carboxylesterase